MKKLVDVSSKLKNNRGATAVYVAILIFVFVGIAAFAIDIGYHRVVRNQLQNAADAAALAACNHFYARNPSVYVYDPDWTAAATEAASAIKINTADNKPLQVGTTVMGWWNITQAYPGNIWPNPPASPPPNNPPTADYGPAVNVTITKSAGQNDGPIVSFFGNIFGVQTTDMSATATAVAASPGSVRSDAVVPVAMAKEVVDKYYTIYNSPTNLMAIGSPYHYSNTLAGQWTSFMTDRNDVPTVSGLISNGNPTAITTQDNIWIQPGTEASLYAQQPKGNFQDEYAGKDIVFPIVDVVLEDTTHSSVKVAGFIGFHVVCAGKGCNGTSITYEGQTITFNNDFVIVGYFITAPAYGGPIGPHYGPLDRCRLCQ